MKKITIFICILLCFSAVVNAAPNRWADKNVDFAAIKTVLVMHPVIAHGVYDEFALQKTEDLLNASALKIKVQFVYYDNLLVEMGKDLDMNLIELNKQDAAKCQAIVKENAAKYADAVLVSQVAQFGWSKQYIAPSSYTYTKYETTEINTSDGKSATIKTPTQKTATMPGGDRDFANAAFGAKLYDAKSSKLIWGYSDARSEQKGWFNDADPERYMKKIIEKAFEDVPLVKVPEK